ncbi:MAG: hypothetical protein ABI609_06015 [Acidobacteriota bacterium]
MSAPADGLVDLLRDLAIAWKNLAAYPPAHPLRIQGLEQAQKQLQRVVPSGDTLSLGVLRDGLLRGEEKHSGTAAQRLAEALHRRHVAVLSLEGDTTAGELEAFLRLLVADPRRAPAPLWDELEAAGVLHIGLQPVDYEGVTIDDAPESERTGKPAPKSLNEAMVRELLLGREFMAFGIDPSQATLEEVLALVGALHAESEREGGGGGAGQGQTGGPGSGKDSGPGQGPSPGGGAAGQATDAAATALAALRLSSRLAKTIEDYFSRVNGAARATAAVDLGNLVPKLPGGPRAAVAEAALRALGTMRSGTSPADAAADRDDALALDVFVRRLPPGEVLAALRRMITSGTRLSPRAVRLAQMLEEASPAGSSGPRATAEVVATIEALFRDEDIDRVAVALPGEVALQALALPRPQEIPPAELPDLGPRLDSLASSAVLTQTVSTLLEMVTDKSPRQVPPAVLSKLEELYRELLQAGRFTSALQVVETLKRMRGAEALEDTADDLRRILERLGNRESVRSMLSALRDLPDQAQVEVARLIERLGSPALRHLLGQLSEEQDRSLRHRILGVLSALGDAVVPEATLLLQDSRWFVVRNMIVLLRTVGDQSALPALRRLAEHGDLRVRMEAIKSLLASDPQVPGELLARAMQDPDPTLAESAIGLVATYGIVQAVQPLLGLLAKPDRLGRRRSVRLRALRTLGVLADPAALPELDRLYLRERWFGRPPAEERLAAFRALAGFAAEHTRPYVEGGGKSRDAAVRAVCRALAEGKIRAPEREAEERE